MRADTNRLRIDKREGFHSGCAVPFHGLLAQSSCSTSPRAISSSSWCRGGRGGPVVMLTAVLVGMRPVSRLGSAPARRRRSSHRRRRPWPGCCATTSSCRAEVVPATVLDLAARRVVRLEEVQPGADGVPAATWGRRPPTGSARTSARCFDGRELACDRRSGPGVGVDDRARRTPRRSWHRGYAKASSTRPRRSDSPATAGRGPASGSWASGRRRRRPRGARPVHGRRRHRATSGAWRPPSRGASSAWRS